VVNTDNLDGILFADLLLRVQNLEKLLSRETTPRTLEQFWTTGMGDQVRPTMRTAKVGRPSKKKRGPGRPPKDHKEESKPKPRGRPKTK